MDTKYFLEAMRRWNESNSGDEKFGDLSSADQSAILRVAQGLKTMDVTQQFTDRPKLGVGEKR